MGYLRDIFWPYLELHSVITVSLRVFRKIILVFFMCCKERRFHKAYGGGHTYLYQCISFESSWWFDDLIIWWFDLILVWRLWELSSDIVVIVKEMIKYDKKKSELPIAPHNIKYDDIEYNSTEYRAIVTLPF